MRHVTVYGAPGIYAGWPANHGAWQRGDELLVGFLRGPWAARSTHNVKEPFEKVLARSLDGGETWAVEVPNLAFEAHWVEPTPRFDLLTSIIRCCGTYDHGGEYCAETGGFYLSDDFGRTWRGAYQFNGVGEGLGFGTMRTAVLPARGLVFLSYARDGFDDFIVCAHHDGHWFRPRGIIGRDGNRAVMPAVAEIGQTVYAAVRRRMIRSCWIDLFASDDDGREWRHVSEVAETGDYNGNPPALVATQDGRLACAYANRTDRIVYLRTSADGGATWGPELKVRGGGVPDIGYPRLLLRSDGQLVCVYYWSETGEPQHIEATIIPPALL